MLGHITALLLRVLEEGEVGDPEEVKPVGVNQAELLCDFKPQRAQSGKDDIVLCVGDHQQHISGLDAGGTAQGGLLFCGEEFFKAGGLILRGAAGIGQPLRPIGAHDLGQLVNLLAGQPVGESLALMQRTLPPASNAPVKTPKPQPRTVSETSINSSPKRVSGLSEPKRDIASA